MQAGAHELGQLIPGHVIGGGAWAKQWKHCNSIRVGDSDDNESGGREMQSTALLEMSKNHSHPTV